MVRLCIVGCFLAGLRGGDLTKREGSMNIGVHLSADLGTIERRRSGDFFRVRFSGPADFRGSGVCGRVTVGDRSALAFGVGVA